MGCFGDMTATKNEKTNQFGKTVTGPDEWISQAGHENYDIARRVLDAGFQDYGGELTAPLSANERAASAMVADKAAAGNPYGAEAAEDFRAYGAAPGFNYDFNTVVDPNSPLGSVSSYMNPFIEQVLGPQLRRLALSGTQARQGINANATQAGAYGDARHGVVEGEQRDNQARQETDVVGNAFANAFGSAMQNRQTDAARLLSTRQAQEGADKAALERMRTSGIDLTGLDKYDVSRTLGLSNALSTTGAAERGVAQATNDRNYQEFLRKSGFQDNQVQFLTQLLKMMPQNTTKTEVGNIDKTTAQPDNTGFQALGALGGAGLQAAPGIFGGMFGGAGAGAGAAAGAAGGAEAVGAAAIPELAAALFL